jgi:hypothetical protein
MISWRVAAAIRLAHHRSPLQNAARPHVVAQGNSIRHDVEFDVGDRDSPRAGISTCILIRSTSRPYVKTIVRLDHAMWPACEGFAQRRICDSLGPI